MENSEFPDLKTHSNLVETEDDRYISGINGMLYYADSLLKNPLDYTVDERLEELYDFSQELLDAEKNITELLDKSPELNSSLFDSLKWYLKGRRRLIDEESIKLIGEQEDGEINPDYL